MDCWSCHEKDDKHKKRLGSVCEDCHNAVDWKRWDFNHDTRTHFKLDGAHGKLDCYACHSKPVTGRALLPMACDACHDHDDIHGGSFSKQCERCHVTKNWGSIKTGPAGAWGLSDSEVAELSAPIPWLWREARREF